MKRWLNEILNIRRDYNMKNYRNIYFFYDENFVEIIWKVFGYVFVFDICLDLLMVNGDGLLKVYVGILVEFVVKVKGFDN